MSNFYGKFYSETLVRCPQCSVQQKPPNYMFGLSSAKIIFCSFCDHCFAVRKEINNGKMIISPILMLPVNQEP